MNGTTNMRDETHGAEKPSRPFKGYAVTLPHDESLEWAKLAARLMLSDTRKRTTIIIPTYEEMVGFYALEKDDQLPPPKPFRNDPS
jgi:hypothetical protein